MVFLLRLIRKNLFVILYLLLLIFSVSQVVRFNVYQKSYFFNTSNAFFNAAARTKTSVTSYFNLKSVNEALAEENRLLREQIAGSFSMGDTTRVMVRDSNGRKLYSYVKARVVQTSTHLQNNFITIDKGTEDGISKDMAVLSPSGIAGIVIDVSDHFALVLSALNSRFKATPMIPAIGYRDGSVTWNGKDPSFIQLNGVSRFEKISKGMKVVTSNYSVKFPPGIPIGSIASFRNTGKSSFYEIDVQLATDFRRLNHLYVVNYQYRAESDTLNRRAERGN